MTAPRFGSMAAGLAAAPGGESFELLAAMSGARVERIASRAVVAGDWYDQPQAEFVLLVAGMARLGFANGDEYLLGPGDWALLPAHCRHQVLWTDPARETLWLAVHLPPD